MQLIKTSKLFAAIAMTASALSTYPNDAHAHAHVHVEDNSHFQSRVNNLDMRVSLLEKENISYGPLVLHGVLLNNNKHYARVQPGEEFNCSFHYKLDSKQQEFLKTNHLIVGISGVAAQTCATHLYGVWDSSGKASCKLLAPLKEGTYEIKIAYREGAKCEDAFKTWNVLGNEPGSLATIGIIDVSSSAPR